MHIHVAKVEPDAWIQKILPFCTPTCSIEGRPSKLRAIVKRNVLLAVKNSQISYKSLIRDISFCIQQTYFDLLEMRLDLVLN